MMISFGELNKPIALLFLLVIFNSCTLIDVQPTQDIYYTIPPVTYFREAPKYTSRNVATVYRGERLVILSRRTDEWCQVQTVQSRQIGWIQYPLLSSVPILIETYYVQENEVPIRDAPQKEGVSHRVLHRGDRVRKLSENQQGWWRVLSEKDESVGWLPATAVSEHLPETGQSGQSAGSFGKSLAGIPASFPSAPKQYFYVATTNLNLHQLPLSSSLVVKVLKFNDKVERVAQSDSNWLKVRYPEAGVQGWAQASALMESPSKAPKVFPPKKKKPQKKPGRIKPAEPETTQPDEIEPEVM